MSGQKLLFRLLSAWNPDDLRVIEGNVWPTQPGRRLPGVDYRTLGYAPQRLFRSRFYSVANLLWVWGVRRHVPPLVRSLRNFDPHAVLTVAHGHLWLAGSGVAQRLGIPLHLVAHDDWPTMTPVPAVLASALHRPFRNVYLRAATRLCVSPYMEEEYHHRYGVRGSVLLPSRAAGTQARLSPVREIREPVLAYAGGVPTTAYARLLRGAAEAAAALGGHLDLYTNLGPGELVHRGLQSDSIRPKGFLAPRELHAALRATADALLLPMSFERSDRIYMSLCFPSKLVEYTCVGVPVLVWGPEYSGGARWVAAHAGSDFVVTSPRVNDLSLAIARLTANPELARRSAERLMHAGNQHFDHGRVLHAFEMAVLGSAASAA